MLKYVLNNAPQPMLNQSGHQVWIKVQLSKISEKKILNEAIKIKRRSSSSISNKIMVCA